MPKPENKPIIAVDIDDVIFPFVPGFVKYLRKHSIHLKEEDFTIYDLSKIYEIDRERAAQLVVEFVESDHMFSLPVANSVEALKKLSAEYEIIIMTARDKRFEKLTHHWVEKHFGGSYKSIHIVDAHYVAGGSPKAKAEASLRLGVNYLIDDLPVYVDEVAAVGIKCLLFGNYAWNRQAKLHQNVTRVKDWQEVLEYFDGTGK